MPNDYEQLKMRVAELEKMVINMNRLNLITPDFKQVISNGVVSASSKGATSENQAVNEAGSATYSVLGAPDGFKVIGGFNFPYYN